MGSKNTYPTLPKDTRLEDAEKVIRFYMHWAKEIKWKGEEYFKKYDKENTNRKR